MVGRQFLHTAGSTSTNDHFNGVTFLIATIRSIQLDSATATSSQSFEGSNHSKKPMASDDLTTKLTLPNGKSYDQPIGLFINNKFERPVSNTAKIEVFDPSNNHVITSVLAADEKDIDKAVEAARAAFEGPWSELSATARGDQLLKLASLINRDRELLAAIDAWDNGKTYEVALTVDLDEAYNVFKYYAGFADKIFGRTIETDPAKFAYVLQEPLGVCGQIIPW